MTHSQVLQTYAVLDTERAIQRFLPHTPLPNVTLVRFPALPNRRFGDWRIQADSRVLHALSWKKMPAVLVALFDPDGPPAPKGTQSYRANPVRVAAFTAALAAHRKEELGKAARALREEFGVLLQRPGVRLRLWENTVPPNVWLEDAAGKMLAHCDTSQRIDPLKSWMQRVGPLLTDWITNDRDGGKERGLDSGKVALVQASVLEEQLPAAPIPRPRSSRRM